MLQGEACHRSFDCPRDAVLNTRLVLAYSLVARSFFQVAHPVHAQWIAPPLLPESDQDILDIQRRIVYAEGGTVYIEGRVHDSPKLTSIIDSIW